MIDAVVAHEPGEEITENMKGLLAQITLRVLGTASSVAELEELMLKVQRTAEILSPEGENLILPGMEPSDYIGTVMEK